MKKFIRGVLSGLFVLAMGSAQAGVIYEYTSAALLTTEPGSGSIAGGATVGTAPTGLSALTIQMTADLISDRPFGSVGVSSWSISDGVHSYSSSLSRPNPFQYFMFSTDSFGGIIEWDIVVSTYNDATCNSSCAYYLQDFIQLRSINLPSYSVLFAFDQSLLFSAVSGDFGRAWDYNALSAVAPGSWTMRIIDDENRIPEPGTLALFGIAIAGLGLTRRRKPAS
jgi:hypothetical protein